MSSLRFKVLDEAFKRKAVPVETPNGKTSEYFAKYVFNRNAMNKYLSKETLKVLTEAIDNGKPLNREIADHVDKGMRIWAMEAGATLNFRKDASGFVFSACDLVFFLLMLFKKN